METASFDHETAKRQEFQGGYKSRWGRILPGTRDDVNMARRWATLIAQIPKGQHERLLTRLEKDHSLGGYGPTLAQVEQAWKALEHQLQQNAAMGVGPCGMCDGSGWIVVPALEEREGLVVRYVIGDFRRGRLARRAFTCLCSEGTRRRKGGEASRAEQAAFSWKRDNDNKWDFGLEFQNLTDADDWYYEERKRNPDEPLSAEGFIDWLIAESIRLHPLPVESLEKPRKRKRPRHVQSLSLAEKRRLMRARQAQAKADEPKKIGAVVDSIIQPKKPQVNDEDGECLRAEREAIMAVEEEAACI